MKIMKKILKKKEKFILHHIKKINLAETSENIIMKKMMQDQIITVDTIETVDTIKIIEKYFSKKQEKPEKEKKIAIPEIKNKEMFPSLTGNTDIKTTDKPENKRQSIFLDDDEIEKSKQKCDWNAIIKNQKPDVKKDSPDYVKPGWVKIGYDKEEGKFVYTYGDPVPPLPLLVEWKKQQAIQKRMEFIKMMEEREEYNNYMHEYEVVPGYEDYEDYESSDDEFIEVLEEECSDDEEYYEDDY